MCLTQAARVIEADPEELVVDVAGRRQRVTRLLVPEARPGDDVLVGLGQALAVLTPAEAAELRELIDTIVQLPNGA